MKKPNLRLFALGLLTAVASLNCSNGGDGGSSSGDGDAPMEQTGGSGGQMMTTDSGGSGGSGMIDLGGIGLGGASGGPIEQLDLLFVIDNSISMADKQSLLGEAVPEMIRYLVSPPCVDDAGATFDLEADGSCPAGTYRSFVPVEDIHIGVISSSLGGHGSRSCSRADTLWNFDDQAHLIPTVRPDVPTTDPLGFLAWAGGDDSAAEEFIRDFRDQVTAVGENGCGFEAPLEAWYRFLVDPQPPLEVTVGADSRSGMTTDEQGTPLIDEEVLAQREAFLRPTSLVNIVVLTDENDCSVMDGGTYYNNAGFGYLIPEASFEMPLATSVCDVNPNDACCVSCLQAGSPPEGCDVSECDGGDKVPGPEDRANVRCHDAKRRFGLDLLYPTDRYVDALNQRRIIDARNGEEVDNPLLMGAGQHAGTQRPSGRIFFTGIIGVPWQDIATQESLDDPDVLEYLTADELLVPFEHEGQMVDRWDVMLGSRGLAASDKRCSDDAPPDARCGQAPVPPLDPFMIESIEERTPGAENPISGDAIVSSTSNNPLANAINGHETNTDLNHPAKYADGGPMNDDLQYACIFPLSEPKENCTADDLSCDCGDEPLRNSAVCQDPGGAPASTTQYYGKAYPGIRILEVLRDHGSNSVVSSICPKLSSGYTPAITTITTRIQEKLPVVR